MSRSKPISHFSLFLSFVFALQIASIAAAQDDELLQDQDVDGGINFFVDMSQSQKVEGIVVDMQEMKITTGFGDVQVPLDKIDGIRLNAMDDGLAVIAFKNGDILTGVIHLSDLKLKTSWGFATVNIAYINQLSTTKGSAFSSSVGGDGKKKWAFSRGR